jgi:shikimate kinase
MNNIVLIGMPASGKSTVGVILAKVLKRSFIDTDLIIQTKTDKTLVEIIENEGIDAFIAIENRIVSSLQVENSVIATGGSVIYGENAMLHLKSIGKVVYLCLDFEEISSRLKDIKSRGIVMKAGKSLYDVYIERTPLYEKYADVTVDLNNCTVEQAVERITDALNK